MTSTIKVDTIQTAAGAVPKLSDLGINDTGTILQVKRVKLGELATSSSTFTDIPNQDTSVGLNITPSSASNDILIILENHIYVTGQSSNAWRTGNIRLLKDGSYIFGDTGTSEYGEGVYFADSGDRIMTYSMRHHLDSPNTTSEITYKLQGLSRDGSTAVYFNKNSYGSQGMMTLMEIAG